ncbi:hypothetical protein FRC07_000195 [Ceratobasidium sp. 392]|nr:hypothetical protein FRC07_000195 [Ceratobasidium sp. 392]
MDTKSLDTFDGRVAATFLEVADRIQDITWSNSIFDHVLRSFGVYLAYQEDVTLFRKQLDALKSQSILSLESNAKCYEQGGDVSEALSSVTQIFASVSALSKLNDRWSTILADLATKQDLENAISKAFDGLAMHPGGDLPAVEGKLKESRNKFLAAQREDRSKIAELEAIIGQAQDQTAEGLEDAVQQAMVENLQLLSGQNQVDATRALAILVEVTGKSLPPSTLLGKTFVTFDTTHEIHQGTNYDIVLGKYFNSQEIAIKLLRHCVGVETAMKTHQRFARQALNWSSMRHNAILPFYGIGVSPYPILKDGFQLYMVSPYMEYRDVRNYLRKYTQVSLSAKLQIVLDVARGLNYMHYEADALPEPGNGIVHSALNIFNILVKNSGRAVISGFSHSKVIRDFQESFTGDNNEYRYMAPEMMIDEPHITHGTDIWSWSMAALEILTSIPPFGEKSKGPKIIALLTLSKRPNRLDHPKLEEYVCADALWSLFEDCWNQDTTARPSANDIVQRLKPMFRDLLRIHPEPITAKHDKNMVSHKMSTAEMVRRLTGHECQDVTKGLSEAHCSSFPVSSGGYGDIYKGHLHDGTKVAIKCPRLPDQENISGRKAIKHTIQEIYTASKLRHENIIEVIGVAHFRNNVAMVLPWMEHGTVRMYIADHRDADRISLCTQVASALAYMHNHGIVHGDLKGANILMSEDGKVKITDFGSTALREYTLRFTRGGDSRGLSTRWAAPELLSDENEIVFTAEADVYALGMSILEIITGNIPFHDKHEIGVIIAISAKKIPLRPEDPIPRESQDGDRLWLLLTKCWTYEPSKRPQADEVESIMRTITQQGLEKDARSGADNTVHPPERPQLLVEIAGVDRALKNNQQPASSSATSHAALASLAEDLQKQLSQLDPGIYRSELSALDALRHKLSGAGNGDGGANARGG